MRFRRQLGTFLILFAAIGSLLVQSAFGAGVTIITHGFEWTSSTLDHAHGWVSAMSDSIVNRFGGNVTVYDIVVGMNLATGKPAVGSITQKAGSAPVFSGDSEIVIRLYWDQVSGGELVTQADTADVAAAVEPYIFQYNGLSHPLGELPIHLIGHSRGASVMSELARLLGQKGIWVHQLTLLDPHPVRSFDVPSGNDAEVRVWETVLFADNFYEDILQTFPDGESINGAYNEHLADLTGGYGDGAGSANHSDVHLWYYGTVETGSGASDGDQSITGTMRNTWYSSDEYGGQKAGFYYSRMGGGRWALDGFLFGYNDGNHNILPDTRVNVTRSASEWPSLIAVTEDANGSVQAGSAFPVHYIFQSYDSPSVTFVYLDPDQNPYNGNQTALSLSPDPNPQSSTARTTRTVDASATVPVSTPPGFYYVYGMITGPNGTRYLYALGQVHVVAAGASAVPAITSVSPSTLPPSFSTQLINIYGSNFKAAGDPNASTLIFRDPAKIAYVRTPIFASSSQLQYYITVQSAIGTWSVTVTNAGQAASNLKTFLVETPAPNTGSVTVNLSPSGAVSAGAQWRVDGGSYRNTGDTATGLMPGSHTVSFKAVSGYNTPAYQSANIAANQQTSATGNYTAITPSSYILILNQGGGQGFIVNSPSGSWNGSSYVYYADSSIQLTANANYGYHFVGWGGDLSGTANPSTITMNGNKSVTANFASGDDRLGTVIVTIQPPEAAAAGVTWGFNANDYRASGSSYTTFPGQYILAVHSVDGWLGSSSFTATVCAGQTTNVIATLTPDATPGFLTVTLSPPDAAAAGKWRVNGGAPYASGASASLPSGGNYTITFDSVPGWTAPPARTVEVNRTQTTVASGDYTPLPGPPSIVSLRPTVGALAGGTLLTIQGFNFSDPATVLIGGHPASNVTVLSTSQMTCHTPSNSAYGTVPVIVQTPGGTTTNLNGFAYGVPRGNGIELAGSIGGVVNAVAVHGSYCYYGEGSTFVVLDVSNPAVPTPVGRVAMPGLIQDIAFFTASGHQYAAVADDDAGLQIVDITAPEAPTLHSYYATDEPALGVAVLGGNAYVGAGNSGLLIFDIADPSRIQALGRVAPGGFANKLSIRVSASGVFAYLVNSGALLIVDATDPQNPVTRGHTGQLLTQWYIPNAITLSGNRALLADGFGYLQAVDVSNVDNPVPLGAVTSDTPAAITVANGLLYTWSSVGFSVYNLAGWAGGSLVGQRVGYTFTGMASFPGNTVAIFGGVAVCASAEHGLTLYNVGTPANPTYIGRFDVSAGYYSAVAINGSQGYLATGNSGLKVFDISNAAKPSLLPPYVPSFNGGFGGEKILLAGNRAYFLASGQINILDISSPQQTPTFLGASSQSQFFVFDFYLIGNSIVAAGSDTTFTPYKPAIAVFDISNPASIQIRSPLYFTTQTGGGIGSITGNGSIACAAVDNSLVVVDVSNPASLRQIGQSLEIGDIPLRAIRLGPDNRHLYVGCQGVDANLSWKIVDLVNSSAPVLISSKYVGTAVVGFDLLGTTAYLASGRGILVYDVSDPTQPDLRRSYKTPKFPSSVTVSGSSIYVADREAGFIILQLSDQDSPEVFITSPTFSTVFTNSSSILNNLGGAASDDQGLMQGAVVRVTWSNNRGGGGDASGTESWLVNGIILQPGSNVLTVTASDQAGNTGSDTLAVLYQPPKQNQTITFPLIADRTFGEPPIPLMAAASSGLDVQFSVVSGPAIISSSNMLVLVGGGSVTIRATQPGDDQFNAAPAVTNSFNVGKADQAIAFGLLLDKSVDDPPFALDANADSDLAVTFTIVSGPATINGNLVTLTGAGAVVVRASQSGDTNFRAAPNLERTFVVRKLAQFITFGPVSRQVFGDAPFALLASASSGLPVTFSVLSGPAILSGNIMTMTGAGLVVLRASQSGDATYAPAPNVDQVLIVAPGNNIITDFQRLGNGMFTLRFYGEAGTDYVLTASTNLVNWLPLVTNQISGLGYLEFTDTSSTNYDRRFYRIAP